MAFLGFTPLLIIPFWIIPRKRISSIMGAKKLTKRKTVKVSSEIVSICSENILYHSPKIGPEIGIKDVVYSAISIIPNIIGKINK